MRKSVIVALTYVLVNVCIVLLVGRSLAATANSQATTQPGNTQAGIFISYNVESQGASISIEQAGHPNVFNLASDATARARENGGEWQALALTALQAGEPVTLTMSASGLVQRVDADYETITTQLVIESKGYVIATNGGSYKLIGKAAEFQSPMETGTYLRLRVDPQTSNAFDIAASTQPFAAVGPQAPRVAVTFIVQVPPNTPPSDIIYMANSGSNWTANGVRFSPLTGNRWSAVLTLDSGSSLEYRYTRGSWNTDERNAAGQQIPNRSLRVTKSGEIQQVNDTVVRWADLSS